jgi:pSer/pThr/pTyr-binding forkhead associated (FHA) protein
VSRETHWRKLIQDVQSGALFRYPIIVGTGKDGSRRRANMSVEAEIIRIGRSNTSDVVLSHASVSRNHAEMMFLAGGSIQIRDLQSTGGTFVTRAGKEQSVSELRLEPTDALRFGDYDISVVELLGMIAKARPELQKKLHSSMPVTSAAPLATGAVPSPAEPVVRPISSDRPQSRMVRCDCGTIKQRGANCPACGT